MRSSGRRLASVAILVVALTARVSAAAEEPAPWRNWSHFREIGVAAAGNSDDLLGASLPDDLWEHARTDLADLRLVDREGNEVGYVLFSPGSEPAGRWRSVETIDRGVVPDRYSQVVVDTGGSASMHNAVEVTLAGGEREVFAWTEVAASDDRETWRIVRPRAPLFRFDERGLDGPVTIGYPRTRDRWLRLRLLGDGAGLEVAGVRVGERSEVESRRREVRRALNRGEGSSQGESVFESPGSIPEMPISGVRIETAREEFHRLVVVRASDDGKSLRPVGRGLVYRYVDAGERGSATHEQLEVVFGETAAPHWRVTIMDRGDPPIGDLRVRLLREETRLVFRAGVPGPVRLLYGNHRAEAPEYELARLVSEEDLAGAREATLGGERVNELYESPEPFTERHPIVLWAALALAVLVVGGLAIKSLR